MPWRADGTGGATTVTNLQPLARAEHLLKQAGEHGPPGHGWRVVPGPAGVGGVIWSAPTGHRYPVRPDVLDEGPPGPEDVLLEPPDVWPDDGDEADDVACDWSTYPFTDDLPADPLDDPDDSTGELFDDLTDERTG